MRKIGLLRLSLLCLGLWVATAAAQDFQLRYEGKTWKVADLQSRTEQTDWINAAAVFSHLQIAHQWNPLNLQLQAEAWGKTVVLTPGFLGYRQQGVWHPWQNAPQLRHGSIWLTQPDLANLLQDWANLRAHWNSATNTLEVNPAHDLLNAKLESRSNGDLLELNFARTVRYESFFHAPHFILRLNDVTLQPQVLQELKGKLARKVSVVQEEKAAQITVLVSNGSEGGELLAKDEGKTLQILFRKPQKSEQQVYTPAPKVETKKIKTIVIDPGHGGKDPGALGAKSQEKEIVLAVGLRLREILQKAGFTVKMTRDKDVFVELQERPAIASQAGGDLFISLHCNAIDGTPQKKRNTEGFKIYILREAESEEDRAIARRENQAAMLSSQKKKSEISPVEWILLENQLNLYTKESEVFTSILVDSMAQSSVAKHGSGAGQAGFMVLVGAFMPSALVELGFITNPKEELYMMSKAGQAALAERIAQSVIAYRDNVEKRYLH